MKLQKETCGHGKWYGDACAAAFALEVVGERWALLIVRELMLGGRRFSDLRASLPGISAKVLTERLEGLESAGVLRRRDLPPPAAARIYELTDWGYAAEEPIKALGRWAAMSSLHDPTLPLSGVSLMLSFRAMFLPDKAGDAALTATARIAGESFHIDLRDGDVRIVRGEAEAPDFTIAADAALPVLALVYGNVPLAEAEGMGLSVSGDRDAVMRFAACFDLPEKLA